MRISYFRDVTRSGVSAPVKEAMAMRSSGHLLQRAGREFVRNLLWMAVVFGSLVAILAAATDLSLVEVMAFVGVSVTVMAANVTVVVLWSGAPDETRLGSHDYPGSPHDHGGDDRGGDWPGGGWDGGGGGDGGGWGAEAAFRAHRNALQACS
jgi:uncharacterized membrane protein YgcG